MSLAKQLATPAALSVWLHGARAVILGVRDHGQDDKLSEGLYTPSLAESDDLGSDAWWPISSWTSPSWSTTTMLTNAPDHTRSSTTSSTNTRATGTSVIGSISSTTSAPSTSTWPTSSSPSETLITDMPSSTETWTSTSTSASGTPLSTATPGGDTSGIGSNQTLVVTLSSVLSALGALLIIAAVVLCCRYRNRRGSFFARGISPIDDEEIATWKVSRHEKMPEFDMDAEGGYMAGASKRGHTKQLSTSSKKAPSVIVYNNAYGQGRPSIDGSPQSPYSYYRKMSLDRDLPATPIQARAPNAVAGLTDESVPGAVPFVTSPRRHPSRLSKAPPGLTSPRAAHTRSRSSRSSMRSMRSYGDFGGYYGSSEAELSPRGSQDYIRPHHGHSRVYSSSELPPRLSLGDDGIVGGLSPRPVFRDEEIGRAIG